jgi:hypothetical protein
MIDEGRLKVGFRAILEAGRHCELATWYIEKALTLLSAPEPGQFELQQGALMVVLALSASIAQRHGAAHGNPALAPIERGDARNGSEQSRRKVEKLMELGRPREAKGDDNNG